MKANNHIFVIIFRFCKLKLIIYILLFNFICKVFNKGFKGRRMIIFLIVFLLKNVLSTIFFSDLNFRKYNFFG